MTLLLTSERFHEPLEAHFTVGSLVCVTCYGPYRGLKGIIWAIDVVDPSSCFYLVALLEGQMKEPLWLLQDDIAAVEGENPDEIHSRSRGKHALLQYHEGQISIAHMRSLHEKLDEKRQEAHIYGKMRLVEDVRTMMTEHIELLAATDRQLRVRYQEQIEIDQQLIQKQRSILQDCTEHMHELKSLIELKKEYIENQKQFIQHNRERIEMLKHTIDTLVWKQKKTYTTPQFKEEQGKVMSDGSVAPTPQTAMAAVAV